LQVFVIIGDDDEQPLAVARLTGLPFWLLGGQQPGNRLLIAGNHQFFACGQMIDQFGQFGLGFFNRHGDQGCSSFNFLVPTSPTRLIANASELPNTIRHRHLED